MRKLKTFNEKRKVEVYFTTQKPEFDYPISKQSGQPE